MLAPHRTLDLRHLDRVFVLRCHDTISAAIAPALVSTVQAHAPRASLRFLAETEVDTDDLRHGRVDLEIGATRPDQPEIRAETLAEVPLVVALRTGHRLLDRAWTAESYASAQHVIVSRRGRLRDPIDEALARIGMHRHVVAAVPTRDIALKIVAATDNLAAIADYRDPTARSGLPTRPFPIALPPVPMICIWHQRCDDDPAHRWLRQQVRSAALAWGK